MSPGQIFTVWHPGEHSRSNILQWILTKLGTYILLKRIWNPIDFQGQRSRSQGLIFRRGCTPRFASALLILMSLFDRNGLALKKTIVQHFIDFLHNNFTCNYIYLTYFKCQNNVVNMIISEHLIDDVTTKENTDQKILVEPGNTIKSKR